MKRVISIIKKDFILSLRDNIVVYIMVAPLLLALVLRMFLPSVEEIKLNFVIEENAAAFYLEALQQYGDVEVLPHAEAVKERVDQTDAIPGIILKDNNPIVIFEGNEPPAILYSYEPILETILNENPKFQMTSRQIGDKQPILYGIMSMVIVMLAIFFGGTVSGFNIVAEKDTKTIRSMSVSPLKMSEFVAARGVVAILISIIIGLLSSLILAGVTVNYYKILLMLLASSSMTVIIALLIGRIANNQISSIATIKVIMPVFITLPLVSLFIPKSWQLLLYPLPNYWAFMSLYHIFLGEGSSTWFFASISALFLTGTIYLLVLSKTFKNHFSLR